MGMEVRSQLIRPAWFEALALERPCKHTSGLLSSLASELAGLQATGGS